MKHKCYQLDSLTDAFDVANDFTNKHVPVRIYGVIELAEPAKPFYLVVPDDEQAAADSGRYKSELLYEADSTGCTFYPTQGNYE